MKAVFPCTGVVIVTKNDVDKLINFYKDNLINSKLFSVYNASNYSIQVGNFSYLPKKSNIVLENAHMLTIQKLHQVIGPQIAAMHKNNEQKIDYNTPLDDNFILNHPFFETLKPLN